MCGGTVRRWIFAFAMLPCPAVPQTPVADQLARFQEKVRQDMSGIPNYTCLETIDRTHRMPRSRSFRPVDTVRLEVSNVDGKELFAFPGASHFEDRDVGALVAGGAMGTGMFALFAQNLFVAARGTRLYRGEQNLAGRAAVRYDFRLTKEESGLQIKINVVSEIVAAKGSFWFDPDSLDLLRMDMRGDAMPHALGLDEVIVRTQYARTHIGDADALLPAQSEMTLTRFSGESSRNIIDFSQCHAYISQSTISFAAPPASLDVPKPQVREVDLPAGLLVPIELETAIDSKTSSVGDPLHGRVVEDVRDQGALAIPRGAAILGHILKLNRAYLSAPLAIGIEISDIEWEGVHARFRGELLDIDRESAGKHHPVTIHQDRSERVLISRQLPGAGVFFIDAGKIRIPPGFHMLWRTLARSVRIEE